METLDIGCLSGARGNKADRAMSNGLQATAKPSAGVPRRSSLTLWSLEGEQEFRRSRHRALQHRATQWAPLLSAHWLILVYFRLRAVAHTPDITAGFSLGMTTLNPPVGIRPRSSTVMWVMVTGENKEVGFCGFVVCVLSLLVCLCLCLCLFDPSC